MTDESIVNHDPEPQDNKETEEEEEEEPLKGSNQTLIRKFFFTLLRRPLMGSCYYSVAGLVGASVVGSYGGFIFHATLYAQAIFVLGPMGAAQGLLTACREVVLDSGLAARVGREVYNKAVKLVQDKQSPSQNLKEAIENLRESYPMAESIITGEGILGFLAQTFLGLFLPNVGEIFDQIEKAIDWSEDHETELADTEIVARATTGYIEAYIRDKENTVTTVGGLLYTTIAGVSLFVSAGVGSLFDLVT